MTDKKSPSTHDRSELSKLEQNLRRFEDERRRFEIEKQKFEKEKCEMNKIRYQRLEDFERKRQSRKITEKDSDHSMNDQCVKNSSDEHEKLYKVFSALEKTSDPISITGETIKIAKVLSSSPTTKSQSPSILTPQENKNQITNEMLPIVKPAIPIKTKNKIFHRIRRTTDISDDYESSTALSSSSRDGDFDEIDDSFFDQPIEDIQPPIQQIKCEISSESATDTSLPPKISWWQRLFKKNTIAVEPKDVQMIPPIKPIRYNRDRKHGNISLYRLFFIESRQVWQELLEDYPDEWEATKIARNRCISNMIILTIFCGFGGMIFRFVEGAFESFYKCGVRRVKRDFVDNLWLSSHNLRFLLIFLLF